MSCSVLSCGVACCSVFWIVCSASSMRARTARSREHETRNARRNADRNPRWSKLILLFKWAVQKEALDDHRGFRFAFRWPFRVSSSRERTVRAPWQSVKNKSLETSDSLCNYSAWRCPGSVLQCVSKRVFTHLQTQFECLDTCVSIDATMFVYTYELVDKHEFLDIHGLLWIMIGCKTRQRGIQPTINLYHQRFWKLRSKIFFTMGKSTFSPSRINKSSYCVFWNDLGFRVVCEYGSCLIQVDTEFTDSFVIHVSQFRQMCMSSWISSWMI